MTPESGSEGLVYL